MKDQAKQPPQPQTGGVGYASAPGVYQQNPNEPPMMADNNTLGGPSGYANAQTPTDGGLGSNLGRQTATGQMQTLSGNPQTQTQSTGPVYYTDVYGNRRLDESATGVGSAAPNGVGTTMGTLTQHGPDTGQNNGALQTGTTSTPGTTGSVTAGQLNLTGPTAGALQTSLGNFGPIQGQVQGAGNIQTGLGNAGNIQSGLGNAGNIQTGLSGSGDIQRSLDLSGLGNYATQANYGGIQNSIDTSNVPKLVGGDALRGAMTEAQQAAYQNAQGYLDPQWQQDQAALESKLANQGVMQNSEAWNKAMGDFQRNKEFAYAQARSRAVSEGNAANQQLFGQGLAVNQNQFGQNLAVGQFANAAQAQGAQQSQFNAQLQNQARMAQANELMQAMNLGNQAQNQAFGQNLAGANFANSAQAQNFGQNLAAGQFGNAAQAQTFGQNLAAGQFGNAAQQQLYGQNANNMTQANAAQNQGFQQGLAGAQFANQTQNQNFTQGLASQAANNAAQGQQFTQGMQNAQLQNALQEQLARQGLTREQIAAQLAAAQYGANAQTSSAAAAANASMTNAANALAAQQEQNRFGNSMDMRRQDLNEMLLRQQNQWDMYNRATNGIGVTNPNFPQTGTVGSNGAPDLSGLNRDNYTGQLNNYNAQVGQNNAQQQALINAIIAGMGAYGRTG